MNDVRNAIANDWLLELFSYQQYNHGEESSNEHLKKALWIALDEELSEIERECFLERYLENHKVREIARHRGCAASTVSRTIRRAEAKLFRVLKYTNPRLLKVGGANE